MKNEMTMEATLEVGEVLRGEYICTEAIEWEGGET